MDIGKITLGSNDVNLYLGEEWIYGEKTVTGFPGNMTSNTTGNPYIESITGDSTPTKSKDAYWTMFDGVISWNNGYNLDAGFTLNMYINFKPGFSFKITSITRSGKGYDHCIPGRIRVYDQAGTQLCSTTAAGTTAVSSNVYNTQIRVQYYASSESQEMEIQFAGVLRKDLL